MIEEPGLHEDPGLRRAPGTATPELDARHAQAGPGPTREAGHTQVPPDDHATQVADQEAELFRRLLGLPGPLAFALLGCASLLITLAVRMGWVREGLETNAGAILGGGFIAVVCVVGYLLERRR